MDTAQINHDLMCLRVAILADILSDIAIYNRNKKYITRERKGKGEWLRYDSKH